MDFPFSAIYNNVKNNCKGGKNMRKLYIDNIRWITVVLVVLYHVIKKKDGKIVGSIHPWAFSVLVDFRILQSADQRWIRGDGSSSKTGFYLSSWQSAA